MTPEQLQALISAIQASSHNSSTFNFNWVQSVMALGATLVSVTGVVVGMRAALTAMSRQLDNQGEKLEKVALEMGKLTVEVSVLKYAQSLTEQFLQVVHGPHGKFEGK